MIDAHNHLDRCADPLAERDAARALGVQAQIMAGVDAAGWRAQARLARQPDLWVTFGVHPWTAARCDDAELAWALAVLPAALDGALDVAPVGLGELGLDHGRRLPAASSARQERAFRAQLGLARERNLPLVLHIVQAHGRALEILREEGLPAAGGMVHSASIPAELVPAWLDLGLYLSWSGALSRQDKLRAAASRVPLDRLLVETDAPDQPPRGHGTPNRPAWLPEVVAALAGVHGVDAATMAEHTTNNARRLFGLEAPVGLETP